MRNFLLILSLLLVSSYSFGGKFIDEIQVKDATISATPTTGYGRYGVEADRAIFTDDSNNKYDLMLASLAALDDLSDVDTTGAIADDHLIFNGLTWEATAFVAAQTLNDLTDVDTTGAVDGNVIQLNAGTWEATALSLVTAIDELTDVTVTTPATDNILAYDGAGWINKAYNTFGFALLDSSPTFTGTVTALAFSGDGSGLTGLVTDHGALTGLADDDHTQYSLADGTRPFSGAVTLQNNFIFSSNTFTGVATGTTDNDEIATKGYVDESTPVLADASYVATGLLTGTKYGDFDTNNTDKYGYRNAEDNSTASWTLTGLTNATFTVSATSPLFGTRSYLFGNVTGSASESAITTNVAIPSGSAGRSHGVTFNYSYDGADNDIRVEFVDVTNSATIDYVLLEAGTNKKAQLIGFTNSTTANVALKAIINTVNNGKFLKLDNIKFEVDPQKTVQINQKNSFTARIGNNGTATIISQPPAPNDFIASVTNAGTGIVNIVYKAGFFPVSPAITCTAYNERECWYLSNSTSGVTIRTFSASAADTEFSVTVSRQAADDKEFVEGVVHSNTYPENVYSAKIPNSGTTVSGENETGWISAIAWVGNVATVTWKAGFFTVAPNIVAMTIVDDATTYTVKAKTVSTTNAVFITHENTDSTSDVAAAFHLVVQRSGTDYKPLTGTVITPVSQTAIISESQTSGTHGGTFTAGSWAERTLNTVEGDTGFVTLAGNEFTVPAGTYEIEVDAPAARVETNKARLYDVTNSAVVKLGTNAFGLNTGSTIYSHIKHRWTISTPTTYRIEHYCTNSYATYGFGFATSIASTNEIYTQVKLTRLK